MLSFYEVIKEDFAAVNALILRELHSNVELVEDVGQHLIQAGGKRLRPLLAILSALSCGYRGDQHLRLAAVIEFIHTATLLHDDVVDTSQLRRGRFTANAQWGNAPSILVGDFLYSRAFQIMVAMGNMRVMEILADTTNIISEGEVQQLVYARNPNITEADYHAVIDKKTAQLFAGAAHTGAVLAGADAPLCAALHSYGRHLGMAFQLVDDVLDYQGSTGEMGKNLGADLAEGKTTLPLIRALQHCSPTQATLVREAIRSGSGSDLGAIIAVINGTDALDYCMAQARQHVRLAQDSLTLLAPSIYQAALLALADFAVDRNY